MATVARPQKGEETADSLGKRVKSLQLPEAMVAGRGRSWLLRVVCVLLVCSTAYFAYLSKAKQKALDEAAAAPTAKPAAGSAEFPTTTGTVADNGNVALLAKGYIVPVHRILISPKVAGMITKLTIIEGQRVEKGALLAAIEDIDYQADVTRAEATVSLMREKLRELETGNRPEEISQTKAELAESQAQFVQMELQWKRDVELRRKNIITASEFELSESKYLAQLRRIERLKFVVKLAEDGPRAEKIAQAKAELRQTEADVVKTKWRLGNCSIVAPIRGTILTKNAEEGNIVNPVAFQGSYSLCEMADLSDMEVDLNIQERDVARVFKGQKCEIRAEAYPKRTYHGVVSRLMPIADRAKGAVPVRVKITIPADEEGVYLKPEMGALVTFLVGEGK